MENQFSIRLNNVSKIYRLYGSQREQLLDVLGLNRIGFGIQKPVKEFAALHDVSLNVPCGHRIGIIGRNGAGKTTLLKLVGGNFAPTFGVVEVNGSVQALFGMGLGFHPDYTGRENVKASLQYNGLSNKEYAEAMEDILDFCELEEFIDQPFRTYSTGMQARLMFAAATAIHPDILIVDEVLGAGDAYFVAKSKIRVEGMVSSGCTMLLVSHSMAQVLELCKEAIWLDQGRIRMQGEAFLVVKAYEEYINGPIRRISIPESNLSDALASPDHGSLKSEKFIKQDNQKPEPTLRPKADVGFLLQEPRFLPHEERQTLAEVPESEATLIRFTAPGGLSRWNSEIGLKVCGFSIVTEQGITNSVQFLKPVKIVFFLLAEVSQEFNCRYGIAIHDLMGRLLTSIWSPPDLFKIDRNGIRRIQILLNPNQIGPGEYTLGVTVLDAEPLEKINSTRRYDQYSRSFSIKVPLPGSLASVAGDRLFMHSAEWLFDHIKENAPGQI